MVDTKMAARAAQVFEDVNKVLEERDLAIEENGRLRASLAMTHNEIAQKNDTVRALSHERDYYMRYCTEMHTHLNNIQITINECVAASKQAAYRKNTPVPTPNAVHMTEEQSNAALKSLADKLKPDDYVPPKGFLDQSS